MKPSDRQEPVHYMVGPINCSSQENCEGVRIKAMEDTDITNGQVEYYNSKPYCIHCFRKAEPEIFDNKFYVICKQAEWPTSLPFDYGYDTEVAMEKQLKRVKKAAAIEAQNASSHIRKKSKIKSKKRKSTKRKKSRMDGVAAQNSLPQNIVNIFAKYNIKVKTFYAPRTTFLAFYFTIQQIEQENNIEKGSECNILFRLHSPFLLNYSVVTEPDDVTSCPEVIFMTIQAPGAPEMRDWTIAKFEEMLPEEKTLIANFVRGHI